MGRDTNTRAGTGGYIRNYYYLKHMLDSSESRFPRSRLAERLVSLVFPRYS